MSNLMGALPAIAENYDVVILNGRVMDPESNLDAVRNIGISKGTIQAITTEPLQGNSKINAQGLIVSPGFIDTHVHLLPGQDQINFSVKATDGVTTALDLEAGTEDVDGWYAVREGKAIINYGASASHAGARMKVMKDPGPMFPSGDAAKRAASEAEIKEIKSLIEQGLDRGAIGIGLLLAYTPAVTREEMIEIFRTGNKFNAPCYVHIKSPSFKALQEVIEVADATRGPLHVVHINSMGLRDTPKFLQTVSEARSRGLDVTTECYPYTAAATGLESALFDEGWQQTMGITYKDLEWAATGERLTEETFKAYRQKGGIVIVHLMSEEMIQLAVAHPLTIIASDSLLMGGKGHPRSTGTFCRVLGQYVREKKTLTLMEALRKMTLMPAQRLEGRVPAMRNKGRIRIGADADITVFDPEKVIDKATFKEPIKYSEGIHYVLVSGVPVVKDGQLQTNVTPGKPIRTPVK
jgi:N-acyl-D-aspartate/D-glutamate deacylase